MNQLQNLINPQPGDEKVSSGFLNQIGKVKFGVLAVVSLVIVSGGVYFFSSVLADSSQPPTLELNTSSMAQGMAKKSVKQVPGFAKFTKEDVDAYDCNPAAEVALGDRVVHLFAKQKVTLKEIAAAIHPTEGSQYLIAFYKTASEDEGDRDAYYLYPTNVSPFIGGKNFDVKAITDGEFEIPAYRGFHILIDNADTLFCKRSLFKTSTDNIWFTKDGEEISFDRSVDILKSMGVLPKGWVMLPAGDDTSIIGGFIDLFGKDAVDVVYYRSDSGEFKKFDYDKDWNSTAETGTKLIYNTTWFHLKKKVNVAFIIDDILAQIEEMNGVTERYEDDEEDEADEVNVVEEVVVAEEDTDEIEDPTLGDSTVEDIATEDTVVEDIPVEEIVPEEPVIEDATTEDVDTLTDEEFAILGQCITDARDTTMSLTDGAIDEIDTGVANVCKNLQDKYLEKCTGDSGELYGSGVEMAGDATSAVQACFNFYNEYLGGE